MLATAFLIGFVTAFGVWSATKVTDKIDQQFKEPEVVQKVEKQ